MRGISERPQRQAGFSVAEVLVAVFMITVGLVGLAGLFPVANQSISTSNLRTTAALLAEQQMEAVKSIALTSWGGVAGGTEVLPSGFTRTTQVAPTGDPNLVRITVTVVFPNQAGVQLVTFVANRI
jgi:Tfp pilus assembly protein PilV